jgi:hypothetical protein
LDRSSTTRRSGDCLSRRHIPGGFLFLFAAFTCWLTISQSTDFKVFVGYWSRELPEYAEASWDSATKENLFDGLWKFGRTVGVAGAMISIPLFLVSLLVLCFEFDPQTFAAFVCFHIILAILSILLLSGLGSDVCDVENCRIGAGGICAIVDVVLWIVAAVIVLHMRIQSLNIQVQHFNASSNKSTAAKTKNQSQGKATAQKSDRSISETENDDGAATRSPPRKKRNNEAKKAGKTQEERSTEKMLHEH